MVLFSICDFNYLQLGVTLAKSVLRNIPNSEFKLVLSDENDWIKHEDLFKIKELFFEKNQLIEILLDRDILPEKIRKKYHSKYNIIEYCTAIKPTCFEYFFSKANEKSYIVYLDPDIYVYNDFQEMIVNVDKSIFLTPHTLYQSKSAQEIDELREFRFMQVGVFNLGFLALKKDSESPSFIAWWKAHLEEHCKIDYSKGLFVDQKWMDFVPCLFNQVEILKDPGLNIAYWNIKRRTIDKLEVYFIHYSAIINLNEFESLKDYLDDYSMEIELVKKTIRKNFETITTLNDLLKFNFLSDKKNNELNKRRLRRLNRWSLKLIQLLRK